MLVLLAMKKLASLRSVDSALLALVALGAASSTAACSKEESREAAWSCTSAEVPQGSVVRCTQQAATSDGPPIDSTSTETAGGTGTTDGFGDLETDGTISFPTPTDIGSGSGSALEDGTTLYTCTSSSTNPDCPALDAEVGSGSGSSTEGSGASSTDGSGTTDTGAGGTQDGVNDGSGSAAPGGGSSSSGPSECVYVPELPYCGGATDGASSGDGSTTDCTKKNCGAPGQTKDGTSGGASSGTSGGASSGTSGGASSGTSGGASSGTSGGASSGTSGGASSGTSGGASSGTSGKGKAGGHEYTCKKDKKGNKACQSVPSCAKGSHPSSCGACVSDGDGASECLPQSAGGCWVTGGGFVVAPNAVTGDAADGHDNFGGNAKPMKDGTIKGHWNHVDHGTGNHAKGRPEYIYCRQVDEPGPGGPGAKKGFTMNQVYFGGPAEWRDAATGAWGGGYWFDVVAKDHGEPGSVPKAKNGFLPDTYHFTIRLIDDPANNASGTRIYETQGELQGGNIQLHPPNNGHPATQSTLPAWVSLEP